MYVSVISFIFYPVIQLVALPIAWYLSLKNALILTNGRWSYFIGYHPITALNCLFYRTQLLNIDRFGFEAKSSLVGGGNFELKKWFHLSLISSYVYSHAAAVTTLLFTLLWIANFSVWINNIHLHQVVLIVSVLFLSSTAYSMAFARQNYQIIGWAVTPLLFYTLENNHLEFAVILLTCIVLLNITVHVLMTSLLFVKVLLIPEITDLYILFVSVALLCLKFRHLVFNGQHIKGTLSLIGAIGGGVVRYKRPFPLKNTVYFGTHYLLSFVIFWWLWEELPFLLGIAILGFFMNQILVRIADEESFLMFISTVATTEMFLNDFSFLGLATFYFCVSPIANSLSLQSMDQRRSVFKIPIFSPFDSEKIFSEVGRLFENVDRGKRVLFAFDDPGEDYGLLFDGYRPFNEAAFYIANRNQITLLPDFHFVTDNNRDTAGNVWGRDVKSINENMDAYNCEFVLCYTNASKALDVDLLEEFTVVGSMDWKVFSQEFSGFIANDRNSTQLPVWFVLKRKDDA
ncbi:hypothetical protein pfor_22c2448 [Rhodobacteraceae bacterium SB2]|nr:hypothetical protein pfor_22c2448 [Rhodobacteraceae bacterium SB2]